MRYLLLAVLAAAPVLAQTNRPEVFFLAGAGRASGDEGSLGSGPAVGGAVTLPFARRWAVDLDVNHIRARRETAGLTFRTNHTHFSPGLQYRRGNDRHYGFVAFGAGLAQVSNRFHSETNFQLHAKGGFVAAVSSRIVIRGEVFLNAQYAMPDIGVRGGVGWRF